MLSWLAKATIGRNMAKASEGKIEPTLKMDAEDVRRRFADVGGQIWPDEVVLKGFPRNQTISSVVATISTPQHASASTRTAT